MRIVGTFDEVRSMTKGSVGLVPTMGALHEGHLSHVEAARSGNATVVVSVFVNPLQFNERTDLDAYPRDLARDAELAEKAGADIVFAPAEHEIYPEPPLTSVVVEAVSERMEGAHRPGHFAGVAIVVTKLLAGIRPDRAYFGRKDAQQLAVVKRLVGDLSLPVEVVSGPIIRERDGLALSSRNVRLNDEERRSALALSTGIEAVTRAIDRGEGSGAALEGLAREPIVGEPGATFEYAALAAQRDAVPLRGLDEPAFLAVAARVGRTRLIDNVHIDSAGDRWVPDPGRRLDGPSILYGEN